MHKQNEMEVEKGINSMGRKEGSGRTLVGLGLEEQIRVYHNA